MQAASINRGRSCLRKAFNLAKREWCRENPVSRVSLEKGANKRDRWLIEDEEARLLSACPSWLRDLVVFALHTGMRLGEILSLTWRAVDLFRRTAHGAVESYLDGAPHRDSRGAPPENKSPMMT
jgi:integrase